MFKKILKVLYNYFGLFICKIKSSYLFAKYRKKKPHSNTILIVAHPDDELLRFHTIMKKEKPFVVLMSSGSGYGSSLIRMREFKRAMKYYGLQYIFFTFGARDQRTDLIKTCIMKVLAIKDFEKCYSHNEEGEYGHEFHKKIHEAVLLARNAKICVPFLKEEEEKILVLDEIVWKEKEWVFKNIYKSQSFVLNIYKDWVLKESFKEKF